MTKLLLILSLTLGLAFPAFALPPAYKILRDGKIIHKEVHYQKDSPLFADEYDFNFKNQIIFIQYVVIHLEDFYDCWIRPDRDLKTNTPYLDRVDCRIMHGFPTRRE